MGDDSVRYPYSRRRCIRLQSLGSDNQDRVDAKERHREQ